MQTLLRVSVHPMCTHEHLCARKRSCSPCQSSVDYGNNKTPSMHWRLGSAALSQLAFPGESNQNFPWEKSHWDNTVVKSEKVTVTKSRSLIFFSIRCRFRIRQAPVVSPCTTELITVHPIYQRPRCLFELTNLVQRNPEGKG